MQLESATVRRNEVYRGEYRILALRAPAVAPQVRPGQFVHIRLPRPADAVLRRPFSVFRADAEELAVLYKAVGRGTAAMRTLQSGDPLSVLGPLGNGFPVDRVRGRPVLVAGGYGMAALYLAARALPRKGLAFFGGRTSADILCVPEFEALGWTVEVATEDGSLGRRGLVTEALDAGLARAPGDGDPELLVCGPNGLLRAAGERAVARGWTAWLSLDRHMGCGVGACLTCVQKVRDPASPDGWTWARVCREGPVFEAREVVWD
jgi:dihydroorotate dehydrogenase electron transfer subunit